MFCEKILLAYDGTEGAQLALEKVLAIAKKSPGISVHLLYVAQPPQAMVGVGEAYIISPESLEAKVDPEIEESMKQAELEISRYATCAWETTSHENPGKKIILQAKNLNCDLIVIGSRGLGGFKKLILGSISSYVVNHASIPVLVVK